MKTEAVPFCLLKRYSCLLLPFLDDHFLGGDAEAILEGSDEGCGYLTNFISSFSDDDLDFYLIFVIVIIQML